MKRRFLIVCCIAAMSAAALAETSAQMGPFCWAGKDDHGKDIFVPCHSTKEQHGIVDVALNIDTLAGLRINTGSETIMVSREQALKALEEWRAENHAKP